MQGSGIRTKLILVTAFGPFGGERLNPTEMVLAGLPDTVSGYEIRRLLLPVEFAKAGKTVCREYDRLAPAAVIMLGQAGGRSAITPETTGRNIMNGRIPDNAGFRPDHLPISEGGPDFLRATLPVDKIIQAVRALGLPCEKSDSAGEYVCNSVLYSMLEHNGGIVPTGFIHVPFIREQMHADRPYMEFENLLSGITAAVAAVADTLVD